MGAKGYLYYSYFPTRGDGALSENLRVQLLQTLIKHLLCARHAAGHLSCFGPF